jgi:NAD(P)-dependent dehydrogenase (short-subunit alcohol dehydrogenase family)
MARVSIVTGGSRGIGFAIAQALLRQGDAVAITGSNADGVARAAAALAEGAGGSERVLGLPCDVREGPSVDEAFETVETRFGGIDVLVNNAGVGIGAPAAEQVTKRVDMQLDVNFRAIVLFYRECLELLRAAAAEHRNALVVNTSSISGKSGQAWLSVYSATKAAVIGYTEAMNKELSKEGIKSTALCPAFVDTPMTEFAKEHVPAEAMITTDDVASAVGFLLGLSPNCLVPEIVFERPGDDLL